MEKPGNLELAERALGTVDEEDFRRVADACQRGRAQLGLDQVDDTVGEGLHGDIDVQADDLSA
jgi:hypothetical protein